MTTTVLAPYLTQEFFTSSGAPLAGGFLFSYQAGTNTPIATYTDSTGATPNANPILLNARGEASVWVLPNVSYKFVLQDPSGNTIWTRDQVVNQQLITLYGGPDTGIVNAYVLNFAAPFTNYVDGTVIYWLPAHTNTGPSTLSVNGLAPVAIVNQNLTALAANQLLVNQVVTVMFKGGVFLLVQGAALGVVVFGTDSGSANNYIVTTTTNFAYNPGNIVYFVPIFTNTGNSNINVNGLGVKNIRLGLVTLVGGELPAQQMVELIYDGTNFQVVSPGSINAAFSVVFNDNAATGVTAHYSVYENIVVVTIPIITYASTSTSFSMVLPNGIQAAPTGTIPVWIRDNGVDAIGAVINFVGGSMNFGKTPAAAGGFTAAGVKGFPNGATITYRLN